jgi:hypothetical protein
MVIFKIRSGTGSPDGWGVYHESLGNTKVLLLESTAAAATSSSYFNNTSPTSSVMTVGTWSRVNNNGGNYVAYCFSEVAGYSKFGSYTGNGSADGPFVFTNFKPRYLMVKRTDSAGQWVVVDTARSQINAVNAFIYANLSNAEDVDPASYNEDILANGWKIRSSNGNVNANGATYIFMAFAEHPFKHSLAR